MEVASQPKLSLVDDDYIVQLRRGVMNVGIRTNGPLFYYGHSPLDRFLLRVYGLARVPLPLPR